MGPNDRATPKLFISYPNVFVGCADLRWDARHARGDRFNSCIAHHI